MFCITSVRDKENKSQIVCSRCNFTSSSSDDVQKHIDDHISVRGQVTLRCEKCTYEGSETDVLGNCILIVFSFDKAS